MTLNIAHVYGKQMFKYEINSESQMQILLLILGSLPQHRHVLHDVGNK